MEEEVAFSRVIEKLAESVKCVHRNLECGIW